MRVTAPDSTQGPRWISILLPTSAILSTLMAAWLWLAVDWLEPIGSAGFAVRLVSFFVGIGVLLANLSVTMASFRTPGLDRILRVVNGLAALAILARLCVASGQ
ncbi:MAG: hypothetical protein IT428_33000 [Planctomycetaceae bacterium]|nr:hypothetical protein [Planctomycetaceae bacterium]